MTIDYWQPIAPDIWTGRDDSEEGATALRLFQTTHLANEFTPQDYKNSIALLGFLCDEGVRLNKGRIGANEAPNVIRKALANLAAHANGKKLVDLGNIAYTHDLASSQHALAKSVKRCQQHHLKTVILGGGHETAYGHGLGLYECFSDKKIGIINFDAHLDIRLSHQFSSGTPFKQLADYCQQHHRPFNYMCIGASPASNTQSVLETAQKLGVHIIFDTQCHRDNLQKIQAQVLRFINLVDIVYLTVDLDVLPSSSMYAVSAPAGYGVELSVLLEITETIKATQKLQAVDFVEFNPSLDVQGLCSKVAARFIWQTLQHW